MKNVLFLNTLRNVKRYPWRFAAITAIIIISCAFYTGVKASCPDLKESGWKYFREQALADIQIKSTLGFDEGDCGKILESTAFDKGYAGYSADLFLVRDNDGRAAVKVMSYSAEQPLNKLYLTEGRLPEKAGECVADADPRDKLSFAVGDKITLEADGDNELGDYLDTAEYTVVGLAKSPLYVTFDRGITQIGTGTLSAFFYIPKENFTCEKYTDIYLSVNESMVSGAAPFSDEYDEIIEWAERTAEDMAGGFLANREADIRAEAEEELADARKQLADGEKKLADGKKEYDDGLEKYNKAYDEIKAQKDDLEAAEKEYNDGMKELTENEEKLQRLHSSCDTIDNFLSAYDGFYVKVLPAEMLYSFKSIQEIYDENNVEASISDLLAVYIITDPEKDPRSKLAARAAIEGANEQVRTASTAALWEIEAKKKEAEGVAEQLAEARAAFDEYDKELEDSKKKLDDAKKDIDEAQAEIDDANAEIADAEKELDELFEDSKWYVWNRSELNPGCMSYGNDAERVDSIAAVFPIFFILIAALVCCTTMSRMVEEQRTETGTMKALGFGSGTIIMQYVLYAVCASIIGSAIGTVIGFPLLPNIIYRCYDTMYNFPIFEAPFMPMFALVCAVVSLLCTGLSAVYSAAKELLIVPAQLIRPKPPKDGKRILLERIGFIWKRMKFSSKVTFRNLLRYKSRFFMAIIGIGGCTALLLTAFGLKQAISCIADKQYDELFLYDVMAVMDDKADDEKRDEIRRVIAENSVINSSVEVIQENRMVSGGSGTVECYIFSPESTMDLGEYIVLRNRKSGMPVPLDGDGAVITEKLSYLLGVGVGDSITIDGASEPVTVSAIAENYTFHYVFLTRSAYTRLFGESRSNTILMSTEYTPPQDIRESVTSELIACDGVISAFFTYDSTDNFRKLVSSLDLIVIVLIVFAGALAFVILFNLANININERVRELATIKVLGFFDGEVGAYIYRENTVSAVIGIIFGLAVGIFFERFVILTAEVDEVMFSRDISWLCFVLAAAVMAVFTVLVNFLLYFKLKGIDMAASMKAIE